MAGKPPRRRAERYYVSGAPLMSTPNDPGEYGENAGSADEKAAAGAALDAAPQPRDPNAESELSSESSGPIVGIGASAGGLEAFTEFLRQLPATTGMAFVLVQHLDPRHESVLAALLGNYTRMPVVQVQGDVPVEPDHVYVIPPNATMVISGRTLHVSPPAQEFSHQRRPIDAFFTSLAEALHTRAIGIVLSGAASDGTLGLKAIKAEGGITFAQDATAKFDGMPHSAIAAGVVDFVLPPKRIAQELAIMAREPLTGPPPEQQFEDSPALGRIFEILRKRTGVDFSQYKPPTIHRRLSRRLVVQKVKTPEEYLAVLEGDPREVDALFDDLLIKVTEFFRDPGVFDALKKTALPFLAKDRAPDETLRVWVPGCSTGEEVYSIAIALLEYLETAELSLPVQIFGTDVSERVIERARAGVFDHGIAASVSPERLRRFFSHSHSRYQIKRNVRDMCVFSRHNLGSDPPLSRMDLISCRNLLIYFAPALQQTVIDTLAYALRPTGRLLVGFAENTGKLAPFFEPVDQDHRIYSRKSGLGEGAFEFIRRINSPFRPPIALPPEARPGAPAKDGPVSFFADHMLFSRYGPSGLLVDKDLRIVELSGEVKQYLQASGAGLNLLEALREDLVVQLRAAIREAHERQSTIRLDEIQIRQDRALHFVRITVIPVSIPSSDPHSVILFENLAESAEATLKRTIPPFPEPEPPHPEDPQGHIQHLERELANSREYLQSIIEELRSTNEEAQSANEELQSSNEELQTTKEELEASNEELFSMNAELQSRNTRQSDDLVNLLSSISTPIVMVDNNLHLRHFTPAAEKVLHLIAGDIGRPISDIKPRINVADLDKILAKVIETLNVHEQAVQDFEGRGYLMRVRPNRTADNRIDGAVLLLIDVTDLRHSLEAEARYRRLFDSARDGIVILDAMTGEIADVNPYTEHLLGYARGDLVGRKLGETELAGGAPILQTVLEQIRDRNVVQFPEVSFRTRDGRGVQAELVGSAYLEGDRRAIQLNIRDIGERRKFERELQHTQKLESLGLLAGGIAHDFNNLLTGIMGNASLMYADMPADNQSRMQLRSILAASEQAANLTRQLLAYAGKGRFITERIVLSDLIREIVALIQSSIPKTVDVTLDLAPDLPPVAADPSQVQQLVMNLVINGAEAIGEAKPGSVEIRTGERELTPEDARDNFGAEALAPGRYVWLEVKDTGAGMDEATKAKVFDPFFTTKFLGRGLGLAAVSGIVRTLRGAIRVYSAPGRGSSFYVLFPAAAPAAGPRRAARPRKAPHGSGTVLVIDDQEMVRQTARAALEKSGFQVLEAEDGRAGVDLFRKESARVSLIILDLTMPVMGGEEAFDLLRSTRSDVPILLASGYDETEAAARTAGKAFAGFLHKPFQAGSLIEAVGAALGLEAE